MNKIPDAGETWGILGGSFDPVHFGHINLAAEICKIKSLDGVLMVPSFLHAIKSDQKNTDFENRIDMLNIATSGYDIFAISSIEKDQNLSGYSLDTVLTIKTTFPETDFYFIIGSDNLSQIHLWHQPERLLDEIKFVTGSRPNSCETDVNDSLLEKIEYIKIHEQDVSSTKIRELLKKKDYRSLSKMIHPGVIEYIMERNLYQ